VATYPFSAFFENVESFVEHFVLMGHLVIGNDVWIGQLAKLKPPGLVALVHDIQTFYRLIWINSQIQNLLIYCVYSSWE